MDADRFDTLAKSLTTSASRRGALTALLGGALGLLAALPLTLIAEDAEGRKRKGKGKKKKKPTAPPASPPLSCAPICGGKSCGADGCGGTCGSCTGPRTCQGGSCVCPTVCGTLHPDKYAVVPSTCACCLRNGGFLVPTCGSGSDCCSGDCQATHCVGKAAGAACTFGAQCASGTCSGGNCT